MIAIINALIVNEKQVFKGCITIKDGKIENIYKNHFDKKSFENYQIIDAEGNIVIPGIIDDQVHFREPGLTHKADIESESIAAVAGGITSFMEMPNTNPPTISIDLLEKKFQIASEKSVANFSFYFGATNNNFQEIQKIDNSKVCGVKIFMGSSTGNMLVDNKEVLNRIFKNSNLLLATHCEDEETIRKNTEYYRNKFGENIDIKYHKDIRSEEACYKSSSYAVELAHKYNARLHVLHISTAKELDLFSNNLTSKEKKITSEVCVHHLWFNSTDYQNFGTKIKWNPAIKTTKDQIALFEAVLNNKIDVIATDHAPHLLEEKQNTYFKAPSGGPLVQHSLVAMLDFYHQKKISLEKIVEKMCHTPADIFKIDKRGYIRKGYWADLVLININTEWKVAQENILYKCKWSPFENHNFKSKILKTFVNGNLIYDEGKINKSFKGKQLSFNN